MTHFIRRNNDLTAENKQANETDKQAVTQNPVSGEDLYFEQWCVGTSWDILPRTLQQS